MRISSATTLSGEEIEFGDFNVFVGGNGVGKSTIISELFHKSSNLPRNKYYWINMLTYKVDNLENDYNLLKNSIMSKRVNGATYYYSQATKGVNGEVDLQDELRFTLDLFDEDKHDVNLLLEQPRFRRPFISFSSCDARLTMVDSVGLVAFNEPAQDVINVLYRNDKLQSQINDAIFQQFNFKIILLDHLGTTLELGLSKIDVPEFKQVKQDRYLATEDWKETNYTKLTESGHGVRSMTRLLTSMLEPTNQVILIDEPEIHIYPTQKRWVGKKLVELANTQKKQVFIVTHDPLILQGILDASKKLNIFRVERDIVNKGVLHKYILDRTRDKLIQKSQDQYLQSLFYQRILVVEGAADRAFYQEYMARLSDFDDKDVGLIVAGGKDNTVILAEMACKISLPISFIFDLDVVMCPDLLLKIMMALGKPTDFIIDYQKFLLQVLDITNLHLLSSGESIKKLRKILTYNKRSGFSGDVYESHKDIFDRFIANLSNQSIFVIPGGELESWSPNTDLSARYAEYAIADLESDTEHKEQLISFLKSIMSSF